MERWKESGLTAKEFAAELGINANTLSHWGWKLRDRRQPPRAPAGRRRLETSFVEVVAASVGATTSRECPAASSQIAVASPGPEPLEVVLRDGLFIRVPVRFDDEALSRVVAVLGRI